MTSSDLPDSERHAARTPAARFEAASSAPARRRAIALGLATCAGIVLPTPRLHAQAAPSPSARTLRFIVPLGPGGGLDATARYVAERLGNLTGSPAVVENRPGGDSIVAVQSLLNAPADGGTILAMGPSTLVVNPLLRNDLPYDPARDIRPLAMATRQGSFMVTSSGSPHQRFDDVVRKARAAPHSIKVGTYLPSLRLASLMLEELVGVAFLHVPYRTEAQGLGDLQSGDIDLAFGGTSAMPGLRSGRLRGLAYTGVTRHPLFPDVPTVTELTRKPYGFYTWNAFGIHGETPPPVAAALEQQVLRILGHPDFAAFLGSQSGAELVAQGGQYLADCIAAELRQYRAAAARMLKSG